MSIKEGTAPTGQHEHSQEASRDFVFAYQQSREHGAGQQLPFQDEYCEISDCPSSSRDLIIELINFSIVSVSIGLFFKAI